MERDLGALAEREFDVVVIGGGITGICTAWEAVSRGLAVAMLERDDFTAGASANCLKVVHGGIRHLQRADPAGTRLFSRERNTLLRIAPHQVVPLPMLLPAWGHGLRGLEILFAGARVYDWVTWDRNRGIADRSLRLPAGRRVSPREVVDLFPFLSERGLTGGVVIQEAQMHSPVRLALSFLHSAAEAGARVANQVEVLRLRQKDGRVTGVDAVDRRSGRSFDIRCRAVVNATGGWIPLLLDTGVTPVPSPVSFTRDVALVVTRRLQAGIALAVVVPGRVADRLLHRHGRHLILTPWHDRLLVGAWHSHYSGGPPPPVGDGEVEDYVAQVNLACPGLELSTDEVVLTQVGPVLAATGSPSSGHLSSQHSAVVDHAADGLNGLVTAVSRFYTVARADAEHAVDLVFAKLGRKGPPSRSATTPLFGGSVEDVVRYRRVAVEQRPTGVSEAAIEGLVRRYGSAYGRVLSHADGDAERRRCVGDSDVIGAELHFAVREEMAYSLEDVAFRRTELATRGHPGAAALREAAATMARLLDWNDERTRDEISQVERRLRPSARSMAAA